MKYLVRNTSASSIAHIWNGYDTACKMFSSGGLNKSRFDIKETDEGRGICTMCKNNYYDKKTGLPKRQKNRKRLKKKNKPKQDWFYKSKEWRELRYQALKLHGNQCLCCGNRPPFTILHVDHIKPRSKYPHLALDINNLQVLCKECNLGKSNTDCIDYRCLNDDIDEILDRKTLSESKI